MTAAPAGAGAAPARLPGPLLNEAAPFNRPPGLARTPVLVELRARRVLVVRWSGSLLNEAAPFNQPPGRS